MIYWHLPFFFQYRWISMMIPRQKLVWPEYFEEFPKWAQFTFIKQIHKFTLIKYIHHVHHPATDHDRVDHFHPNNGWNIIISQHPLQLRSAPPRASGNINIHINIAISYPELWPADIVISQYQWLSPPHNIVISSPADRRTRTDSCPTNLCGVGSRSSSAISCSLSPLLSTSWSILTRWYYVW